MKSNLIRKILDRQFAARSAGVMMGRCRTHDTTALTFRMQAGFPGAVNRSHPADIQPCLIDATNPPTFYGQGLIADAAAPNGVRVPASGDSGLTKIWGVLVRPFPIQQQATTNYGTTTIGAATPPTTGPVDVLTFGYIMVTLQGAAAATKGGTVHFCIVAGTGYVVGGFSADTVSGTFITLVNCFFNGPADASGNVELIIK